MFGGGAQHAAKNRKKCQVLRPNVRRNFRNSAEISEIRPVRLLGRLEYSKAAHELQDTENAF